MSTSISPELLRQLLEIERDEDSNSQEHIPFYSDIDALENSLDSLASSKRPLSGRKTPRNKRRPQKVPSLELPLPTNLDDVPSPSKIGEFRSPNRYNDSNISPSAYQQRRPRSHRHQQHSPQYPHHPHPYHHQQPTYLPKSARHTPRLPPLEISILERPRLFLSPSGEARVGIEEIYQIEEIDLHPRVSRSSPFQLIAIPKKCMLGDEAALMPMYRGQLLELDLWKEPIRDREKNWFQDELMAILALQDTRNVYKMTDTRRRHKGKWSRFEALKVSKDTTTSTTAAASASASASANATQVHLLSQEVFIRNQGVMITKTYAIVSVYGIGIRGRLYGAGLQHTNRYLRLEAYIPLTCQRYTLKLTMENLEEIFEERKEFLVAGKKQTICRELVHLLYFQYPLEQLKEEEEKKPINHQDIPLTNTAAAPSTAVFTNEEEQEKKVSLTTTTTTTLTTTTSESKSTIICSCSSLLLCIGKERQPNEAIKRRLEREERLRLEEEERLRRVALFTKLPKRARHRLLCSCLHVQGHIFIVSIYHLPMQVRNFLVIAYHPFSSQTFQLTIGIMQAAATLNQLYPLPPYTKWSQELKLVMVKNLLPLLRVVYSSKQNNKMAIAIEEKIGLFSSCHSSLLQLTPLLETTTNKQLNLLVKKINDQKMEQKFLFDQENQILKYKKKQKNDFLSIENIQPLEKQIDILQKKDQTLKEWIEEINASGSGGGGNSVGNIDGSSNSSSSSSGSSNTSIGSGNTSNKRKNNTTTMKTTTTTITSPLTDNGAFPATTAERHELRRAYKTERMILKEKLKEMTMALNKFKQEQKTMEEEFQKKQKKLMIKFEKSCALLEEEFNTTTTIITSSNSINITTSTMKMSRNICQSKISHKLPKCWIEIEKKWLTSGPCRIENQILRFTLYEKLDFFFEENTNQMNLEEEEKERKKEEKDELDGSTTSTKERKKKDTLFKLELYDPSKSQQYEFQITRLEWILLTKQLFSIQFQIPAFKMTRTSITDNSMITSTITDINEQLVILDQAFDELYQSFIKDHQMISFIKKKKKKNPQQKQQTTKLLYEEMISNRQKKRNLLKQIPWHVFVQSLCERVVLTEQKQQQTIDRPPKEPAMPPSENTMPPSDQSHALPPKMQPMIWLDRCIFSSITPIVCIPMTLEAQEEKDQEEHEEGEDKDVVICCVVKVFLQSDRDLLIEVYDPNSCDTWSLAHRDSQELIKDFEKENFMEMQLYLEVMCSTLKLCTHPITKERFLCFEEEEE